jgi:hypothetical protein
MLETYRYLLDRLRRRGFAPADVNRLVRIGRPRLLGIAIAAALRH